MITLLLLWLVLFVASCISGVVLLTVFEDHDGGISEGVLWKAVWCGLMVLALFGLALSLVGPVTVMAVGVTWGILALLAFAHPRKRSTLLSTSRQIIRGLEWWPSILVIAVSVALYCSQAPCNYDTLLYHHQATKWLTEHGAVQGLVLLHHRLGFISTWFALAAPFEDLLPARSATALNGFVLLLAIIQFYHCALRVVAGKARAADGFLVVSLSVVLGLHLLFLDPVSAAPDFAVSVLTVVMASWLVEASERAERLPLDAALLLAVLLTTVKLSALPLSITVGLAYVMTPGPQAASIRSRFLLVGLLYVAAMVPVGMVSWRQTGAVLFPSGLLAADVDWGLGREGTEAVAAGIGSWARWNGPVPMGRGGWEWLQPWMSSPKGMLFCFMAIGAFVAVGWLVSRFRWRELTSDPRWCVPALGLVGTAYLFVTAPNPRFGFGMLILGWGWIASQTFQAFETRLKLPRANLVPNVILVALVVVVLTGLSIWPVDSWRRSLNEVLKTRMVAASDGRVNWLRPARVPAIGYQRRPGGGATSAFPIDLRSEQMNNFTYFFPANTDICGPAPLPAAPHQVSGIKLASPDKGLSGGFVRVPGASE